MHYTPEPARVGGPPLRDPEAAGLTRPGVPTDWNSLERCARTAEARSDLDDSTADAIRAELGEH